VHVMAPTSFVIICNLLWSPDRPPSRRQPCAPRLSTEGVACLLSVAPAVRVVVCFLQPPFVRHLHAWPAEQACWCGVLSGVPASAPLSCCRTSSSRAGARTAPSNTRFTTTVLYKICQHAAPGLGCFDCIHCVCLCIQQHSCVPLPALAEYREGYKPMGFNPRCMIREYYRAMLCDSIVMHAIRRRVEESVPAGVTVVCLASLPGVSCSHARCADACAPHNHAPRIPEPSHALYSVVLQSLA
jgi:hypothetical protein